ncbi:hypothetical protein ACF0H5_000830 [Mactra antiquata]
MMTSPQISERNQSGRDSAQRHRTEDKFVPLGNKRLWRQMLVGFLCAACLGVIMLILGSVYIGNAIKTNTSITVMLCVLGIVCGLIILCGTACLGKMLLTRKLPQVGEETQLPHRHHDACLHPCSIIYTPSHDQLNSISPDPPPAYEMIIFPLQSSTQDDQNLGNSLQINDALPPGSITHSVMLSPPKYSIAAAPLPAYGDPV